MTDTRTRRPTRQRTAIEADVDRSDEFRSAQEIHASLVAGGDKIGLATVYRTLQAMVDEEALDRLAAGEEPGFEGDDALAHAVADELLRTHTISEAKMSAHDSTASATRA